MKIIGWIRYGDKTACGGTVVEGLPNCTSYGQPISFQGARIACRKGCVIVEGFPRATLPNGRPRVIHGMITSGGCPCYSSLNDIDGVGNESGEAVPEAFIQRDGEWVGVQHHANHDESFDEYFILTDQDDGPPARNRYYRITLDTGEVIEGVSDEHGRTALATSDQRIAVSVEIGRQQEIQVGD